MSPGIDMQAAMALAKSAPLQAPQQTTNAAAAKKAATAFEGVFISQFLGQMFDGISTDGPFGGGQGESMFRSLMLDEYGKQIAAQGGIGLASSVTQELLKTQEVRQ
ncbi:MAG: rod-binding protein [Alphaproteobacteria bacterium]|nr:rod-binding protein [Alphaproteobacteria bacterium]MDE1985436.1 rod-binding protein [Alphaproteobacteria bacterium]MDE2161529.1 rod-binding protein [Alphaproteobacteria bacterium]MDE2266566.1 rod-binding protein [Alphaproteobacteria bacterium]MDE2499913.1 rod-binding protein [Alphaproteobacteria bacterium]